jgi:signal peptidase I
MNIDFALVLVIATFVSGAIWLYDTYIWAPKRRQAASSEGKPAEEIKEPVIVEYAKAFFPVILIVLLLRSFLVEPFRIPSGSMMPTLLDGDFILVNKFAYGVRLPVLNYKIIDAGSPQRGDVVVFRYPKNPSVDYIKRVVGLPGDVVTYRNKMVYVNGEPMELAPQGKYSGEGTALSMTGALLFEEQLGEVSHNILIRQEQPIRHGEFRVPEGHYFVMGDNRDNSNDSRFWGTVPEENLVGEAFMIWMNWDDVDNTIKWGRVGSTIQ